MDGSFVWFFLHRESQNQQNIMSWFAENVEKRLRIFTMRNLSHQILVQNWWEHVKPLTNSYIERTQHTKETRIQTKFNHNWCLAISSICYIDFWNKTRVEQFKYFHNFYEETNRKSETVLVRCKWTNIRNGKNKIDSIHVRIVLSATQWLFWMKRNELCKWL